MLEEIGTVLGSKSIGHVFNDYPIRVLSRWPRLRTFFRRSLGCWCTRWDAIERARFHGLQAVVFGFLWPAAIYVGSLAGPTGTRVVFALGALVWIALLGMTALGRDPRLPGGRRLRSLS